MDAGEHSPDELMGGMDDRRQFAVCGRNWNRHAPQDAGDEANRGLPGGGQARTDAEAWRNGDAGADDDVFAAGERAADAALAKYLLLKRAKDSASQQSAGESDAQWPGDWKLHPDRKMKSRNPRLPRGPCGRCGECTFRVRA